MMKKLFIAELSFLIVGGIILLFGSVNYARAFIMLEEIRKGLRCNNPGSSCPFPDFSDPEIIMIIGFILSCIGIIILLVNRKKIDNSAKYSFVSLFTGIIIFSSGIILNFVMRNPNYYNFVIDIISIGFAVTGLMTIGTSLVYRQFNRKRI
jgi:protein-S-isoprenylcysteine O-methyltransferase Ste14